MICFQRTNGIAHDARLVPDSYIAQNGELTQAGDALPSLQSLSDPVAWQAMLDAQTSDATRLAAIDSAIAAATVGTVTPQTIAQLKAMTAAQFGTWFDANFTTAAQCIALLKALVRVLIRRVF